MKILLKFFNSMLSNKAMDYTRGTRRLAPRRVVEWNRKVNDDVCFSYYKDRLRGLPIFAYESGRVEKANKGKRLYICNKGTLASF